ncbi:MAG: hypothetical protein AAF493_11370 [Pseudomonadota bacterium]
MSNHYHVVVNVDPRRVDAWSDDAVAERWTAVLANKSEKDRIRKAEALLADHDRLREIRKRLGSLSWFMRFINELIARRANREDGCKGRFWEGRFFSSALLDEAAVVSAMTYADTNPTRAGIATSPADAAHTAIQRRHLKDDKHLGRLRNLGLSRAEYIALVRWTIERDRHNVRPTSKSKAALRALGCTAAQWGSVVRLHRQHFRAYGSREKLRALAKCQGKRWIKGVKRSR